MKAEIVQVRCQHVQEYGERYSALAVILEDGGKLLLRVPMWQYGPVTTPAVLQRIADIINNGHLLPRLTLGTCGKDSIPHLENENHICHKWKRSR